MSQNCFLGKLAKAFEKPKPSKGELLYQEVRNDNSNAIRALRQDGATLEWRDKEGRTPLIVACMDAERYQIAKLLIQLGSNVNARPPALYDYTPLYQAASRGHDNIVVLLLSNGANDCQRPLEVAKSRGFCNSVRAIEKHICLFSDWMLDLNNSTFLYGPKKVWVVIVPMGRNYPDTLKLAVYNSLQDARPDKVIELWLPNYTTLNDWYTNRSATVTGLSATGAGTSATTTSGTSLEFAPPTEGDSQLLKKFCDACKGIPQPRIVP